MKILSKGLLIFLVFAGISLQGEIVSAISTEDPGLNLPNAGEMVLTSEKEIPRFLWVAGHYLQAGQLEDVISVCTQVLNLQKNQIAARAYIAVAQKGLGLEKEFNIAAKEIKQQAPDSPILYLALAQLYLSQKDFKQAENSYQEGIKSTSDTADLQMGLASLYLHEGKIEKAEKQYERVLDNKSISAKHFLNSSFAICRIELQKKNYDQVIERAKMVTELYPPIPQGYLFLASGYLAKGETDQVIKVYKKLMSINPESPVPYQELTLIYSDRLNDYQNALSYAKEAVQKFPKDAKSQDVLGWVHYGKKNYKEALKSYQEAVHLAPNNSQYHYHLGLTHLKMGEKNSARDAFELALNLLDPNTANEFATEIKSKIDQCK